MNKLIFLILFIVPLSANADSFYVEQASSNSTSASVEEATLSLSELIKSDVSSSTNHSVVDSAKQAQWTLKPSLLKIGSSYIVTLSKVKSGKLVFSQKMKAQSLEDLDTVSSRLVTSVIRGETVGSTQRVDSVTQKEQLGTSVKTEVTRQFYLGFGPGNVLGVKSNESGLNWTFGYLWGVDHNFSLRLGLQGTGAEGDASMTSFGLGGQYYVNLNKHAPYLLGMFSYSWTEANASDPNCTFFCGISENGFSAEVGGGMHFFRTAKVNVALEVAYTQAFYDLLGDNPGTFNGRILILW